MTLVPAFPSCVKSRTILEMERQHDNPSIYQVSSSRCSLHWSCIFLSEFCVQTLYNARQLDSALKRVKRVDKEYISL